MYMYVYTHRSIDIDSFLVNNSCGPCCNDEMLSIIRILERPTCIEPDPGLEKIDKRVILASFASIFVFYLLPGFAEILFTANKVW